MLLAAVSVASSSAAPRSFSSFSSPSSSWRRRPGLPPSFRLLVFLYLFLGGTTDTETKTGITGRGFLLFSSAFTGHTLPVGNRQQTRGPGGRAAVKSVSSSSLSSVSLEEAKQQQQQLQQKKITKKEDPQDPTMEVEVDSRRWLWSRRRRDVMGTTLAWMTATIAIATRARAVTETAVPPSSLPAPAPAVCDPIQKRCIVVPIQPIPRVTNPITHVVQLVVSIGERREEVGVLRFGLYGTDCPTHVKTMLQFLTTIGLTTGTTTEEENDLDNLLDIDIQQVPVSLVTLGGGMIASICPDTGIAVGIPSQTRAYAKRVGRTPQELASTFRPQGPPRPSPTTEETARWHTSAVAGLISVPEFGIGYNNKNNDDEAYANAFLVTTSSSAAAANAVDSSSSSSLALLDTKFHRRVIGQLIDDESMRFLARLASLPLQKTKETTLVRGTLKSGPPVVKVTILDVGVQKVGGSATTTTTTSTKKKTNKKN